MGEEEERRSLFFFLVLRARSRELADVFEKNEKKIKTTSVYRLKINKKSLFTGIKRDLFIIFSVMIAKWLPLIS